VRKRPDRANSCGERLGNHVQGAQRLILRALGRLGLGGHKDHWRGRDLRDFAQGAEGAGAIQTGHHIEQDHIWGKGRRDVQRLTLGGAVRYTKAAERLPG